MSLDENLMIISNSHALKLSKIFVSLTNNFYLYIRGKIGRLCMSAYVTETLLM